MSPTENRNALFVASHSSVSDSPGGVQLCTVEFHQSLTAAGWRLHNVPFSSDHDIVTRFKRRFFETPYRNKISASLPKLIASEFRRNECSTIFLNQCDILEIVEDLRKDVAEARLVFLSHGLESVDYLHTLRTKGFGKPFENSSKSEVSKLALQLVAECRQREFFDATICLSEVEVEIERWLGAKNVTWIPRSVSKNYLEWAPVAGRVGFVGTLDHPPNAEGLILFLRELASLGSELVVRVVGGPAEDGRRIARQFSHVEYLGALSNEELRKEARTWSCFLHPLFCYPRGASTKLAVGIGWGIPIVTTAAGRRGYRWEDGSLIETVDAKSFTAAVCKLCSENQRLEDAMQEVRRVCESSPSLESIASELTDFLGRQT